MKATGIVRRVDELGRVVIPKEIRKTLRFRVGEPLEIFTGEEGEVVFKKYSPAGELSANMRFCAEALHRGAGLPVIITDRDHVIACAGLPKKEVLYQRVSKNLETTVGTCAGFTASRNERLWPVESLNREAAAAYPILSGGDVLGCVVLLMDEGGAMPTQTEIKLTAMAAAFLGMQLEE